MSPRLVSVKNAAVLSTSAPPAAEWLASLPRGAYTTARTVGGGGSFRVFDLSAHIARLARTAGLLGGGGGGGGSADGPASPSAPALPPAPPSARDPALLRPAVVAGMAAALRAAREGEAGAGGGGGGDWRLTCLVSWAGGGGGGGGGGPGAAPPPPATAAPAAHPPPPTCATTVWVHAAPLPPPPPPPIRVLVAGHRRASPAAKDSAWATAGRADLEALRARAGVEEVLLVTDDGAALVEGLSSNFAVLERAGGGGGGREAAAATPTLVAPGEAAGALAGTARAALVAAAKAAGLAVEDRPPRLADAGRWVGAFVTSTSRGALPVCEVAWPPPPEAGEGGGGQPARPPIRLEAAGGLVAQLHAAVAGEMSAAGEDVEAEAARGV